MKNLELACSVCAATVAAGGRKSAPALCARCYQRDRRGAAPSAEKQSTGGRTASVTVSLSPRLKRQLERTAKVAGFTASRYVEQLLCREIGQ